MFWTSPTARSVHRILQQESALQQITDADLLHRGRELQWRARTGEPLHRLLEEAYALVRESSRRQAGMMHFPVQLAGGIAIFRGGIAEMQTGEGKTLTAVLPATLRALAGKGCHVITTSDYLAQRDAENMGPIYRRLGLSVACIHTELEADDRRRAYACDVTYGTAKEIGFDFLRDRLKLGAQPKEQQRRAIFQTGKDATEPLVQRGHYFALIDEADSILIDDARTPLIIGMQQPATPSMRMLYRWCQRTAAALEPGRDFVYDPDRRSAYLTDDGCRHVLLMQKPNQLGVFRMEEIYLKVEQGLTARHGFHLNRDYVVMKGEVAIVDESTGKIMEGRKWQDGLHQAIEAKEQLALTPATGQAARVTVQSFFRNYNYLAGMTGTAYTARREMKRIYGLRVTRIPTNRPCLRAGLPPRIFATMEAKRQAIIASIQEQIAAGRSVLVGTPSVRASAALSQLLRDIPLRHAVLNAESVMSTEESAKEAAVVERAGRSQAVTVATNMAGRGTDILLVDEVRAAGGLHVIATEMHSSARIDRQLVGRSARQGDPGSFQFFLSLEDELLYATHKPDALLRLQKQARPDAQGEISANWLKLFSKTQRKLEKLHAKQRSQLVKIERQRIKMFEQMGLDPCLELN